MKQASIGNKSKWIIDNIRFIVLVGILTAGCRSNGNEEAEVHMLLMAKLGNKMGDAAYRNLKTQSVLNESESDRQEFWVAMSKIASEKPESVLTQPDQDFVKARIELSHVLTEFANAPLYEGSLESLLSLTNAQARTKLRALSSIERRPILGLDTDGAVGYVARLGNKSLAFITFCTPFYDLQSPNRPTMIKLFPLDLPETPLNQRSILKAVGLNPDKAQEVNYKMLAGKRITGEPVSTAYVKGKPSPAPKSIRYEGIKTHSLECRTYGIEFWSDTWRFE
jgi:hypothetical protein